MDTHTTPLLRTKLYRPVVPADYVRRPGLLRRLEAEPRPPVVLVSAPAGYGKSTLVAGWLQECGRPGAWLSLDEGDNDLHRFLRYFVAAVRSVLPDAVPETSGLIELPALPPVDVLAATLVNELDQIEPGLVLVLDDIHAIRDPAIGGFLGVVLRQPSESFQLVLVGRRDPAGPIATLRAKGMLAELRMKELRFTLEEATAFLSGAAGGEISEATTSELLEKADGWVTGLRLAALALRGQDGLAHGTLELKGTTRYVVDYLVSEVLERQPSHIRDFLLSTSVLRRFCASLCDAVSAAGEGTGGEEAGGSAFIEWLLTNNVFVIPLDTENRWCRYHHLFEELLRSRLERELPPDRVAALQIRASVWCEGEGLIEEAIRYALAGGDAERAADIVERHRDAEFDANQWYVVDRWLGLLPAEIKQRRPRVLLTEARVLNDRFRLAEMPAVVGRAQELLETQPGDPLDEGELAYFLGLLEFWQGEGGRSRDQLERALSLVPEGNVGYVRAQIELYVGLADHIRGRSEDAIAHLEAWIEGRNLRTGLVWERLTFGLAAVHLLGGDRPRAHRESRRLLDDARRTGKAYIQAWGDYLLGGVALQGMDLAGAQRHFRRVVESKYAALTRAAIDSLAGLAIASEFEGQPGDAAESLAEAQEYARWTEDSMNLEIVRSCEARVAVLRGDLAEAVRWQRGFTLPPAVPAMLFFLENPCLTECRVLAALDSDTGLTEAERKLQQLRLEAASLHYTCQEIEIAALQAIVADRRDLQGQALEFLEEAVALAEPGGWLRPFVELGAPMAALLERLQRRERPDDRAERILAAFLPVPPRGSGAVPLPEPLTHRELDVMELLAERLQNKEIAEKLSVSPITVKSHLRNIYQKLNVEKRREAVERARALGFVR